MVIDEKNKFIFIHIPKAAGTSITKFLTNNLESAKKINTRGDTHHSIETFLTDNFITSSLDNYFKFMTVRNPWDWYVSLYEYNKKQKIHEWKLFNFNNEKLTFKNWLEKIVNLEINNETIEIFNNDKTSTSTLYKSLKFSNFNVGWLTHRYIYSSCLNWEEIFKNMEIKKFSEEEHKYTIIDDIYKIEELNENDFTNVFLKKYNLDEQFKMSNKENVNRENKNYRTYYDAESKEMVENKENFLIKKFNYEF